MWIDGNIKVRNDVNKLLNYLDDCNYATYNHSQNKLDSRDCIYEEANAILKVASSTQSCKGATLYVTLSPCRDCSKLIHQSGIIRVVYSS